MEALGTRRIVTTHMVLAEVLNLMGRAGDHRRQRAWELTRRLERATARPRVGIFRPMRSGAACSERATRSLAPSSSYA